MVQKSVDGIPLMGTRWVTASMHGHASSAAITLWDLAFVACGLCRFRLDNADSSANTSIGSLSISFSLCAKHNQQSALVDLSIIQL